MNTVQHKKKIIVRHELRMDGPVTARDIGDFVFQANTIFEEETGKALSDNSYYVTGDEEGLTATFETEATT